jgi:hypothetical protein
MKKRQYAQGFRDIFFDSLCPIEPFLRLVLLFMYLVDSASEQFSYCHQNCPSQRLLSSGLNRQKEHAYKCSQK